MGTHFSGAGEGTCFWPSGGVHPPPFPPPCPCVIGDFHTVLCVYLGFRRPPLFAQQKQKQNQERNYCLTRAHDLRTPDCCFCCRRNQWIISNVCCLPPPLGKGSSLFQKMVFFVGAAKRKEASKTSFLILFAASCLFFVPAEYFPLSACRAFPLSLKRAYLLLEGDFLPTEGTEAKGKQESGMEKVLPAFPPSIAHQPVSHETNHWWRRKPEAKPFPPSPLFHLLPYRPSSSSSSWFSPYLSLLNLTRK